MQVSNKITNYSGVLLFALTIGAFAIGLDTFVIIGALDAVATDMEISAPMAGWIISVYALCYAVFAPVSAWILRDTKRRTVLVISVTVFSLGNLLCALSPNIEILLIGRIISALGAATFTPAATKLATELVPEARKGFALSLIFGGMTVSQVAGIPMTTWIADIFGWRYSFHFVVLFGVLSMVILLALLSGLSDTTKGEEDEGRHNRKLPPIIYGILLVTFLVVASEFTVYSYVSIFLSGAKIGAISALPIILFSYGIGAVMGNFATGFLVDRAGPTRVFFGSVVLQLIFLVGLILFSHDGIIATVIAFFWGVVSYMYLIPIQHRILHHAGKAGKLALALNSSLIYAGITAGSWIGGIALQHSDVTALALCAVGIGSTALIVSLKFVGLPSEPANSASEYKP